MPSSAAHSSTAQSVADQLRRAIHLGTYAPGERLPSQRDLAERLGVSRACVAEGLRMLVRGGYLEVRRGATGGSFVTELRRPVEAWKQRLRNLSGEFAELIDFRVAIESELARLAADRSRRADLTAMSRANADLARAARVDPSEARAAFRSADTRFHAAIAQAARSERLAKAAADARLDLFTPYDLVEFHEPIEEVLADHRAIHGAIRAADGERAATLMRDHISRTQEQLASYLRRST